MMKQKVLIDLERLRYPNSGIANVFKNLVKLIGEHNEVSFYGPQKTIADIVSVSNVVKWNSLHKFFPLPQKNYKVVHVSHQLSSYFHQKKKGQIKVVTLHDLNFLHEDLSKQKKIKLQKIVNKNIRNADVIVCISEFVKQDFLKHKDLFSLKKNLSVQVIYNGVDIPKQQSYHIERFEFLKNKEYIFNIGVLFPKKNQMSLLRMLKHIKEDLVLVTSDIKSEYEDEILKFILDNELQNRVHIFKNINEQEKKWLLNNCIAMCHPSLAEGFGIPPIEAMSFGKPVFLSNKTSLPEIGGDIAFYFENFESQNMAEVFKKGMKLFNQNSEKYSQELKSRALNFSATKMAEAYLMLYKQLLNDEY